jgi:lysozyme
MSDLVLIDISEGCGPVDYEKVAGQVDGVIFRATKGTAPDIYALEHWRGFRSAGAPFGIYGWHNPSDDARQNARQAEALANIVDYFGELPRLGVYGDWETDYKSLSIAQMRQAIWKYIQRVEELLKTTLDIYSSAGFWDEQVANAINGATDIPKGRRLWVANWTLAKQPVLPWDWRQRGLTWSLWQYSNRGRIAGINASVDLNKFNGSRADFYRFFNLDDTDPVEPPVEPPAPPVSLERIRIAHLRSGETLRLRSSIFGQEVGKTWNGCTFDVESSALDAQGRPWYQVGKSVWLASWYTEPA